MMQSPPTFLSLEPSLRCPNRRCNKLVFTADPELYLGALTCSKCGAHWWATRLRSGDVRSQLLEDYYGDEALVDRLMGMFGMPLVIERPVYWQIWLTGNQWYRYNKDQESTGVRGRSRALLKRVVAAVLRAAS